MWSVNACCLITAFDVLMLFVSFMEVTRGEQNRHDVFSPWFMFGPGALLFKEEIMPQATPSLTQEISCENSNSVDAKQTCSVLYLSNVQAQSVIPQ